MTGVSVRVTFRNHAAITPVIAAIDRLLEAAAQRRKARVTRRLVRRLAAELRAAFRAQERVLLRRLPAIRDQFPDTAPAPASEAAEPNWETIFDAAVLATIEAFTGPIELLVGQALLAGSQAVIAELGVELTFDLANPRAVAYLEQRAAELVSQITETTRADLKRLITQAVDEGWSYRQLADAFRAKYAEFATPNPQLHIRDRAELIAVTEIGNGYEAGNQAAVQELQDAGLEMEQAWLTVGDDRVSEECRGNQAAGWIPFGTAFPSGDLRPLAHPGCRCTLLYRRKPENEAAE